MRSLVCAIAGVVAAQSQSAAAQTRAQGDRRGGRRGPSQRGARHPWDLLHRKVEVGVVVDRKVERSALWQFGAALSAALPQARRRTIEIASNGDAHARC